MTQLSNAVYKRQTAVVERIVQFGTGNFLRAFVDWLVDDLNRSQSLDLGVVIVQSTNGQIAQTINEQDGLYTVVTQGLKNGEEINDAQVIECVTRSIALQTEYEAYLALAASPDLQLVVSNTTEAGIHYATIPYDQQPSTSFVANLTHFLYKRYEAFNGDQTKGLTILPCELIEANGDELKATIIQYAKAWYLPEAFTEWLHEANTFCNTLVDRIVPGFPKDQIEGLTARLGYEDELIVMAEPYYIWVIEAMESLRNVLPFKANVHNVLLVDSLQLYRERKVKVLNGAHTALTPVALLLNVETVSEALAHPVIGEFVEKFIAQEVLPTIDADEASLELYKNDVMERFKNPFIKHYVKSIALNTIAKYKTRNVPALLEYAQKTGELPTRAVTALAAWIYLYKNEQQFTPIDEAATIELLRSQNTRTILQNESLWGADLTVIEGLESFVEQAMQAFEKQQANEWLAALEAK